jgi:hypothetical protein
VPNVKPTQKYNTTTVHIKKKKKQNKKYGSSREKQYKRSTGAETLKPESTEEFVKKFHRLTQNLF